MTVAARRVLALVGIAVAVAGLGLLRSHERAVETGPSGTAADAVPAGDAARPALLDFGRGTCVPCQRMMPVLAQLAERHAARVDVRYMDLSEPANQERAKEFGVRIIPTQVLLAADGSVAGRHEGFWAVEEIEARLEELGWTRPR